MTNICNNRSYWIVGEHPPFRLSKDRCQKFLSAIVATGGRIHDVDSLSFLPSGRLYGAKNFGSADALFSISLPVGKEEIFDMIVGEQIRELPPEIHLN